LEGKKESRFRAYKRKGRIRRKFARWGPFARGGGERRKKGRKKERRGAIRGVSVPEKKFLRTRHHCHLKGKGLKEGGVPISLAGIPGGQGEGGGGKKRPGFFCSTAGERKNPHHYTLDRKGGEKGKASTGQPIVRRGREGDALSRTFGK